MQNAVEFIKNYANIFGLPQPAVPRGRASQAPTYLPTSQNHQIVHGKYQKACMQESKPFMQYRGFLDVWHQCIPHVVFMTPRSDVCHYCEDYRTAIQCAVSETDKATHLAEFGKHVEDAQKERDAYLAAIEESKRAIATNSEPNFGHFLRSKYFFHITRVKWDCCTTKYHFVYRSLEFVMTRFPFK